MKKHFFIIPAVIAWAFSSSAFAGYAQLAPPVGWSAGTATSSATYASASNGAWLQNTVRTSASLNVGGRAVTVPVSMRLASNAPRIAAQVLFLHPGIRTAVGLASWLFAAAIVWDEAQQRWVKITESDGFQYSPQIITPDVWFATKAQACQYANTVRAASGSVAKVENGYCVSTFTNQTSGIVYPQFTSGFNSRPVETITSRPLTKEEFERELAPEVFTPGVPSTMPSSVPAELPTPTPLPIDLPVINPSPAGVPEPLLVPTGDPIPNPNYNPQQAPSPTNQPYIQPAVRIKPSPTPDNPWRVDVEPVQQPVPDPTGLPDPVTPETPETPKEPEAPPTDTPLGEVPDLYERKYPDGMEGVWNTYKDQLKNTSLGTLASKLMPNIPDGGTCPQWPINLDMAQWAAFGTHDVAPPCYIWGIAKAILIVSALLLARALIFGG